eukprot:c6698_g1_i1.p1 GENE.c6698_g1_i1~~c6698_g1_i1.p1  ORF type:complete len:385 (+),score=86.33 c6698_g1_i1:35-1189(+)
MQDSSLPELYTLLTQAIENQPFDESQVTRVDELLSVVLRECDVRTSFKQALERKDHTIVTPQTVNDLFKIGSIFEGTILIPNQKDDADASDRYELHVIGEWDTKNENTTGFIIRHSAYQDTQTCYLKLYKNSENVPCVSYHDGETWCDGEIDITASRIAGTVSQLRDHEEDLFVPAEATHVFTLVRVAVSEVTRQARVVLEVVQRVVLALPIHQIPEASPFLTVLITYTSLAIEDKCALLRHYKTTLDETTFPSETHQKQYFLSLAQKGMDPLFLVGVCTALATRLHVLTHGESDLIPKAEYRLNLSFHRFDGALKKAKKRIPLDVIGSLTKSGVSGTCSICLHTISEDVSCVVMKCSHSFHVECVTLWLQRSPSCPMCRSVLD